MSLPKYIPVDCSFHDRIEEAIITKRVGSLTYLDDNDALMEIDSVQIDDWKNEDKEEYIYTNSGLKIRMDRITRFMGKDILGGYCIT